MMTTESWIVLGIGIPTTLALVGLGFAAMSTNPPFTVPKWLPKLFFILAIVVFFVTFIMIIIFQIHSHNEGKKEAANNKTPTLVVNTPNSSNTPNINTSTPSFTFPNFVDASQIDPNQPINIWLGENGMDRVYKWSDFQNTAKTPGAMVYLAGNIPFVPHTIGGKLYLDVQVYGNKDFTPIIVKDNLVTVIPQDWDKNHDDYAYEVVNETGNPIFQLIYTDQFTIVLKGMFPFPGGYIIADDLGFRETNSPFETLQLKPIFRYPSKDHQRERVTQ